MTDDRITAAYHDAKQEGTLAPLPPELAPYPTQSSGWSMRYSATAQLPEIEDDRKAKTNPLNANFHKKEFQELWSRLTRRPYTRFTLRPTELMAKCVSALDTELKVSAAPVHDSTRRADRRSQL